MVFLTHFSGRAFHQNGNRLALGARIGGSHWGLALGMEETLDSQKNVIVSLLEQVTLFEVLKKEKREKNSVIKRLVCLE